MEPRPLAGMTIVEMGAEGAEGIATLLLSDYGAKVIRLEFPDDGLKGQAVRICDRGKTRALFRPEDQGDRAWLDGFLAHTDAVVTSVPNWRAVQWGLDGDTLHRKYPRLVYASVTGYGQEGPYAGHPYDEAAVQAESGLMSVTGLEHGEPVRCGGDFATFAGGANVCIAILMALIGVRRTGTGRKIDVSMMDSILYGMENQFSLYLKNGIVPCPMGNHYALSAPVGDFICKDGKRLVISVATDAQWENFARVLGHEEWLKNPNYRNIGQRIQNYVALGKDVAAAFLEHTCEELIELLQKKHCVYGKINDFSEVIRHPQIAVRKMLINVQMPDGKSLQVPTNPLVMDGQKSAGAVIADTKMCQECDIN